MSSDDQQQETNQDVFDDYVRQAAGDDYIDEPAERIFERLENGEESLTLCINALAITQAAFMMTAVYAPYEEPDWKREVRGLRHRFSDVASQVLKGIESFIRDTAEQWANKQAVGSIEERRLLQNLMNGVSYYQLLAASPQWLWEISELLSLPTDQIDETFLRESVIAQDIDLALRSADFFKKQDAENDSLYRLYGEESAYSGATLLALFAEERGWSGATKWHRRYAASTIQSHVESTNPGWLLDFQWGALLDICLWEVRELPSAELPYEPPSEAELRGDIVDLFGLNPDDSEYWAWLFGRLSSSWHNRVEETGASPFFSSYEAYTPAFALMDGSFEPRDSLGPALRGMVATWKREATEFAFIHSERDLAPAFVSHVSYWIAKLGYRYAMSAKGSGAASLQFLPVDPPPNQAIVPVDTTDTDNSNVLLLGEVTQMAQIIAHQIREATIAEAESMGTESRIREALSDVVWEDLPQDAKYYLLEAEKGLGQAGHRFATLDYARAVEVVLEDWLPPPRGQRDWPRSMGDWVDVLKGMQEQDKNKRHRLDAKVRGRCNAGYASALAAALDPIRLFRVRVAHREERAPRPFKVREIVLGKNGGPSIFELILRFAKKWQPN